MISEAIRNVQKYSQGESLQNVQGNGDFGPSIQFDTKGVDFGPWLRRFVAQIRRNWFVPYAAMSLRGHVVLSFKVHRDGSITDLQVLQPSSIDAFTKSAFNAIKLTNPTVPLPLEFPDENAPFIVTFYFNETPSQRRPTRAQQVGTVLRADRARAAGSGDSFLVLDGARDLRVRTRMVRLTPRLARDRRTDGDGEERARHRDRASGSTARSSAATRRPSIAASTSAPTRFRSPTSAAFPTTWSTSSIRPRSTRRRGTRARRRR